jgi:radical SAM-linked protein
VQYSQGFNPRPKLSLPLPRSVGIESDDELLYLRVAASGFDTEKFKTSLPCQLPEGVQLFEVDVLKSKEKFRAIAATYIFDVQEYGHNKKLRGRIKRLLESENLEIERQTEAKGAARTIDVRNFMKSVEFDEHRALVTVECKISSAGTIRVEEILRLLELEKEDLAGPIRRTKVQWKNN